jgi:hypothetical protein
MLFNELQAVLKALVLSRALDGGLVFELQLLTGVSEPHVVVITEVSALETTLS